MSLNIKLPAHEVMKPNITVFGVGGAGGNATNNMYLQELDGVNFVVANTDAQALEQSSVEKVIQLGQATTQGLGAGADPEVGRMSAEEAADEIQSHLEGSNMVFVTAGMGGGTGTGASSVIARIAKEMGLLTVGVVTKPFHFEGPRRMRVAEEGIAELQKHVDTLIVIPNQNLFRIANERTTFSEAFSMADEVLHAGVRGVTDLMVMPGLINLDFADIKAVMTEMGKAMMGTGEAEGEKRAQMAADAAISNPLLDNISMKGARGVLINITGGPDMTLFEVDEAANRVREEVDPSANVIFGSTFSDDMQGKLRVSVVATGIGDMEIRTHEDRSSVNNSYNHEKSKHSTFALNGISQKQSPKPEVKASEAEINKDNVQKVINNNQKIQNSNSSLAAIRGAATHFPPFTQNQTQLNIASDNDSIDSIEKPAVRKPFVAPKPIEPSSYNLNKNEYSSYSNSDIRQEDEIEEEQVNTLEADDSYEDNPQNTHNGLFSRRARNVAKSFNHKNEHDYEQHEYNGQSEDNDDEENEESSSSDHEELLEIPAFLRRQ